MTIGSGDHALLEAVRSGDDGALEVLLRRYEPRILRFSMKMCRNPDAAQDVLQETLLAAARNLGGFRGASSLSTWLYTIARSFCIKNRRRSRFAPESELSIDTPEAPIDLPDAARDPEAELLSHEVAETLDAAIAGLEPRYREILLLRDMEGLSAPDVAEITGLGVEAVKSRLHRARLAVRERLAPLLVKGGTGPAAVVATRRRPRRDRAPQCPDVAALLSRHLEGDLDARICADMESHLAGCERCGRACDTLREVLRLCESCPEPAVPEPLKQRVRNRIRAALSRAPFDAAEAPTRR